MQYELSLQKETIQAKINDIELLRQKMVMFEAFKYKFEIKEKEASFLLIWVEELSKLNGDLQYRILRKKQKNKKMEGKLSELNLKV